GPGEAPPADARTHGRRKTRRPAALTHCTTRRAINAMNDHRYPPSAPDRQLPPMHLNFPDRAAEKLRERVHGQVVVRGTHDGYHQARQGFVMNYQSFPQIIVYCEVESDVREALHFAKKYALSPVCRAGGHNTAGYRVNARTALHRRR